MKTRRSLTINRLYLPISIPLFMVAKYPDSTYPHSTKTLRNDNCLVKIFSSKCNFLIPFLLWSHSDCEDVQWDCSGYKKTKVLASEKE